MENLMVDIETLGTKPGCIILELAAVEFSLDGETGAKHYFALSFSEQEEANLKGNIETLMWWMKQPRFPEIAGIIAGETTSHKSFSIVDRDFWKYKKVWGNSARFDLGILAHYFNTCADANAPWNTWNERCYRTVVQEFGKDIYEERKKNRQNAHNPLEDCIFQIEVLCETYKRIKATTI